MLAQKLILSYSSRILVQIVQIIASIVVARIAGPSILGTVTFGLAYVTMFSFVADLGFGTAHIKILSEGRDEKLCLGTFARIKTLLIIFYVLFVIGFFLVQKFIVKINFESNDHILIIFIFLVIQIVTQFQSIAKTTFTAFTQQAKSDLPELISSVVNQLFRIIIVLLGFRAVALTVGYFVATIIVTPVFIYLFRNYKIGGFDKELAKDYLKIAIPVMLTAFTSTVSGQIDTVLLQFFCNSEQVGYYSAGYRIGGFVLLISQSVGLLFFPIFSNASKNKDYEKIKNYVEKFEGFSFVFIMPLLILVTLYSGDVVRILLGKGYSTSAPIMVLINIAMFVSVLMSPHASVLVGLGHFKKGLYIGMVQFAAFITGLVVFVHPSLLNLAGKGAAVAVLVSNLTLFILYRIYSYKYLPSITMKKPVIFILFGIINYVIFYLLMNLEIFSGYMKIPFGIIYIILTYSTMYISGLINNETLAYIRTAFDMKSMTRYIRSEL